MTKPKDWMMDAANEAGDAGNKDDVYVAIVKHCPFKSDIAYMPVPRCGACRYWVLRPEYVEPSGACMADAIGSDCNDYTIIVPADFGCVQWEAKP
jgi:hypothetical protein